MEIGGTQVSSSVLKAKSSVTTHYYNSIWNTVNDVVPQLIVCMISTGKIPFAAANFLHIAAYLAPKEVFTYVVSTSPGFAFSTIKDRVACVATKQIKWPW